MAGEDAYHWFVESRGRRSVYMSEEEEEPLCFEAYADEFEQEDIGSDVEDVSEKEEEEEELDPGAALLANVYKKLSRGVVTEARPKPVKKTPRVVVRDMETFEKLEKFTDRHMRLQHDIFARDFLLFMLYASEGDLLYRYRELDHLLTLILSLPGAETMSTVEVRELTTMLRPENWNETGVSAWEHLDPAWRPKPPCQWKKHEEDAMLLFSISTIPEVQKWFFAGPAIFDVASVEQFFFRGGVYGAYEPVRAQWEKCLRGAYGNQGFVHVVQYVYGNYGAFLPPGLPEERRNEKLKWVVKKTKSIEG